jgi:hypothetical protein
MQFRQKQIQNKRSRRLHQIEKSQGRAIKIDKEAKFVKHINNPFELIYI